MLERRFHQRCFPGNFAKYLAITFLSRPTFFDVLTLIGFSLTLVGLYAPTEDTNIIVPLNEN